MGAREPNRASLDATLSPTTTLGIQMQTRTQDVPSLLKSFLDDAVALGSLGDLDWTCL